MLRALFGSVVATVAAAIWWANMARPAALAADEEYAPGETDIPFQARLVQEGEGPRPTPPKKSPNSSKQDGPSAEVELRTVSLDTPRQAPGVPPKWVTQPPPAHTQVELSSRRRGVNPCLLTDQGFGAYDGWDRSPSPGQLLLPKTPQLDADGRVPVMFHFHGHEAARKHWVQEVKGAVLFAFDLGVSSGPYLRKFSDPATFTRLLRLVEAKVSKRLGRPVQAGRVGLSSWSAGYGAVQGILESSFAANVDVVILLDGLHTSSVDTPRAHITLRPFVQHAQRAATGDALMYISHSSILPPSYASTTETANFVVWQLGGTFEPLARQNPGPLGLELVRRYSQGDFHVRGFSGNGKLDHCAQLAEYGRALRSHVVPRWGL